MIGKSIAHYTVTDKIGEGGMGEVYKATDSKLHRDVALKVLPDSFARDFERLARFGREAEVLASLNHPNIAIIHGLEEDQGVRALVMELVEGETLEDLLQRRGALPVLEAAKIASQIAQALEEAHEHGIIHRDLKPANVKITPSGLVKVLDFGLAKALEGDTSGRGDLSHSPTISLAATQAGIILGTAGYMSPEQASGRPADRRADIWSFGVLLYEMLTGRRAFAGETVSHTLAAVLHGEPDLALLPDELPSRLRRLLQRCLTKDPRLRLQAIGEARVLLEQYVGNPASFQDAPAVAERSHGRAWLPWAVAGALAIALAVMPFLLRPEPAPPQPSVRLKAEMGEDPIFLGSGASLTLSPDGRRLAYVLGVGQDSVLAVRSLDQLVGTQLPGTEGGYNPFFSPDGEWVGFATTTELRKVSVTGGTPLGLTKVSRSRGASWGDNDTIIFTPDPSAGLAVVPGAGGEPRPVTELGETDVSHRWPQYLPGSHAALYTAIDRSGGSRVEAVDLETGDTHVIHPSGAYARYARSGHIIYFNEGTLFAAPFDLEKLEISGTPAPVMQGIQGDVGTGGAQYAVSASGTLVFLQGTAGTQKHALVWVDHLGRSTAIAEEPQTFAEPRLSPDGKRLAVEIITANGADAWVYDLERGASTRLTFAEGHNEVPVWSPDGEYIAFSSDRDGSPNVYRKRSDGSGDIERLTESETSQYPSSWSPDGRYLLMNQIGGPGANSIWVLDLETGESEEYLDTPFSEAEAAFSPDGRWVAYQSDENGNYEVFVRPFPNRGGGKWQISIGGGNYARWSPDGKAIYYRTPRGASVVRVATQGDALRAATPEPLFQGTFAPLTVNGNFYADWDVAADGERFIMFEIEGSETARDHLVFVLDWFDELRSTFARPR